MRFQRFFIYILVSIIFFSCKERVLTVKVIKRKDNSQNTAFKIYTNQSDIENNYIGFNSQKAINRIAGIENEYFNWKAYLIINEYSGEYQRCIRNYNKTRTYNVWKQPDIRLEKVFHSEKDTLQISELLKKNEFGWGFSDQGLHTWITRFDILKECNWSGTPSYKIYRGSEKPLFISTKFKDFYDYNTHIIIFPPKKN